MLVMDFVVIGAGAIGGVVGGRLQQSGHAVSFVARGDHLRALQRSGLRLELPDATSTLDVEAVARVEELSWDAPRAVLLSVKSQDTEGLLDDLVRVASPDTPVFCLQNGVENERRVLRRFAGTYGVCVMCPATHLRPGVVQAHSAPIAGLFDLGRFPGGADETAALVAGALGDSGFESLVFGDIMRWKYAKLLSNLTNAVEALCGPAARGSDLAKAARQEGRDVLAGSGVAYVDDAEYRERRGDKISIAPTASGPWSGGSSWQSATRGAGSIEADYLNGEIVLLARLGGVPAPVNAFLQQGAGSLVRDGAAAGTFDPDKLLDEATSGTV